MAAGLPATLTCINGFGEEARYRCRRKEFYIPTPGIWQITRVGYRRKAAGSMAHNQGLLNRLNRIQGQVRGIARMVEEERYCIDVLTQLRAVRAALSRVESELLKNHLNHCIEGAFVSGDAKEQRKKAAELINLLSRTS